MTRHGAAAIALLGSVATGCGTGVLPAPPTSYEQLQRTEVYRAGTIVTGTEGTYQIQLAPPERLLVQGKGVAAEIVQEILDRRALLPVKIARVYVEGRSEVAGQRPKVDVTEQVKVVGAERDRVTVTAPTGLALSPGERMYFKSPKIRIALVSPPVKTGMQAELPEMLLEDLTTFLANTDQFALLERSRIDALLAELQLSMQDFVDPKTSPRIGRLLGAEAVLVGSLVQVEGQAIANVRVVDVERGEVVLAARKEFARAARESSARVVRVIPENGAKNVPPSLKEIVIIFDRPMRSNWNITCSPAFNPELKKCVATQYWLDDRTFVFTILPLKTNQPYSFTINGWMGTPQFTDNVGFRALDTSKPADVQRFFFATGP